MQVTLPPITVQVRYFASIREAIGLDEETVQVTTVATIGDLRQFLIDRGGVYAECLAMKLPVRVAVNNELSDNMQPVMQADVVAFFPPVTGG
jgi:sulfur-carrier protein